MNLIGICSNAGSFARVGTIMIFARSAGRLAVAAVMTIASAITADAYSDEAIKNARTFVIETFNKSLAGLVSRTDVELAQYNLLTMEYKARVVSPAKYCSSAEPSRRIAAAGFDPAEFPHAGGPTPPN